MENFQTLIKKMDGIINIIALLLWIPGIIFLLAPTPKVLFGISLIIGGAAVVGFWAAVRIFEKKVPKIFGTQNAEKQ